MHRVLCLGATPSNSLEPTILDTRRTSFSSAANIEQDASRIRGVLPTFLMSMRRSSSSEPTSSVNEEGTDRLDIVRAGVLLMESATRRLRILRSDLSGPFPILLILMALIAVYNSMMLFQNPWEASIGIVSGLLFGSIVGYTYRSKLRRKQEKIVIMNNLTIHDLLKLQILKIVLGEVPSWVKELSFSKVEWVNSLLHQLWPYYDRIFCKTLKENIEPLFEYYKPSSVKYMGFKNISLGSSPLEINGIRTTPKDDSVVLEVDVVWGGSALIQLAIHAFGAKMSPKMTDVVFQGTLKIILKPLLDSVPFFGAASISFVEPPTFYFDLDFGKVIPVSGTIKNWMIPFIKSLLEDMMVWPNRLVIPLLDESITGPLGNLYLTPTHCLHMKVISARNLPNTDWIGKSDPYVVLYTRKIRLVRTSTMKNNLNPIWNEEFDLLIEEIEAQPLHIEVYDEDFSLMSAVAGELMGRCKIWISELELGTEKTMWIPLGLEAFSEDSCGEGCGELQISLLCNPIQKMCLDNDGGEVGALIVRIVQAKDLLTKDWFGQADAYVSARVYTRTEYNKSHNRRYFMKKATTVIKNNANPAWNETLEFISIPRNAVLDVRVKDQDFGRNDVLGSVHVKVAEVASRPQDVVFPLQNAERGSLQLQLQWFSFG